MKKLIAMLTGLSLIVLFFNCGKEKKSPDTEVTAKTELIIETVKQKESYAMGFNTGKNMKNIMEHVGFELFLQGLNDAVKDHKPPMTLADLSTHVNNLYQKVRKSQAEKRAKIGLQNKEEGQKFLKENKYKEGVKVTKTGLQYIVIIEGIGKKPKDTDRVQVHYRGTFINGIEFDSSFRRNKPAAFLVNGVISGWTEGLQMMKTGAKYRFFVPSELAYGKRGIGNIGPNAVLIFDVELQEILPKEEPKKDNKQSDK